MTIIYLDMVGSGWMTDKKFKMSGITNDCKDFRTDIYLGRFHVATILERTHWGLSSNEKDGNFKIRKNILLTLFGSNKSNDQKDIKFDSYGLALEKVFKFLPKTSIVDDLSFIHTELTDD